ncbi:hypothetical protein HGH93_15615 [Chitinophaga polysaccharea]|uniref:hypothetical protein n=1 Tax=Chitinophaga TaxID=79328 RepID=UPI0014559FDA|nr:MULTISPECIES: hypothetical protein [Chitinophaga]NLR59541.1 hypothetical protein [Chitinophaga polysaccharea]NLU96176.1 hypothetical protein [Chitinophaga sp. Ak27]
MKYFAPILAILLFVLCCESSAQLRLPNSNNRLLDTGFYYIHTGCKMMLPVLVVQYEQPVGDTRYQVIRRKHIETLPPVVQHPKLITIHGNITYDGYYQYNADTPFLERDLYQHTLQTTLDIMVKEEYPLHVAFSTSMGNSQFFRNITGANFQYYNQDFKNQLLAKAKRWDAGKLKQKIALEQWKDKLDKDWNELNQLKSWFTAPAQLQKMAELKEYEYRRQLEDSLKKTVARWKDSATALPTANISRKDSILLGFRKMYDEKKLLLDSLVALYAKNERLFIQKEKSYVARKGSLMDALQHSRNEGELISELESMNLPDSILPKGYKAMLAVKSLGLGRTLVDYSELTAKNISFMGVQAEVNPSWYVAFATGKVDYRFRDFIVNDNRVQQYLNMIRMGVGKRDDNHLILSFYTGKKQVYNFNTGTSAGGAITPPDYKIMGLSLEGRWQLNRNNYVIGEVAKSSLPYYVRSVNHQGLGGSMLGFNDHSNEAYALSAFSFIPATSTRINGMYKRMGANFQSFSLYATGSAQDAWMLQVTQPFFKQQLTLTGSVRQNVYTSVFDNAAYRSNTIFKSIQATFRRKRWPVLSVGYFPSSQLMKLSEDKYVENLFYTLVGTGSYYYNVRNVQMNSIVSATRFYNHQADSNFVYFNSTNLLLNQTVFLGKLTLNGGGSMATNTDYALYGADGSAQYRLLSWLELGAGVKYNYQTVYEIKQFGYLANMRLNIRKIGEITVSGDKGFVPGVNKQLVPNKTARLTYTKIF